MTPEILLHSRPDATFAAFLADGEPRALRFRHRQYYLEDSPELEMFAAFGKDGDDRLVFLVSNDPDDAETWLEGRLPGTGWLAGLADHLQVPLLSAGGAWRLEPVSVAKPWGREIWYTGIEARGQSRVGDGRYSVPLPWVLALGSDLMLAPGESEPNLLKVLDPLPEPIYGDLYFELHEQKREVYVVTHVSERAWPSGQGAIRYGFDPAMRRRYDTDAEFRHAYRAAVRDYERVRREIDGIFDEFRAREGIAADAPVESRLLRAWEQQLPRELVERERRTREAMNAFTHMMPLAVGDVVGIATHRPHALQHGVRTVEFQTPVYERKILSFAQKVLTQDHWDTAEAVEVMSLEPGMAEQLPVEADNDIYRLEQAVAFEDFRVYRLTLAAGGEYRLPEAGTYRLVMGVSGRVVVAGQFLEPEQAALVPRSAGAVVVTAGDGPAVCLISVPAEPG